MTDEPYQTRLTGYSYRLAEVGGDTVAVVAHFGQNVTQRQGDAQDGLEWACFSQ